MQQKILRRRTLLSFQKISKNETDLSVNRPDSDVPEVSYEPIIIDIPDGPIPAGETWDNEVSATDIAENDIPTADGFRVPVRRLIKLWISVGVVSGAGVEPLTTMCQKATRIGKNHKRPLIFERASI